MIGIILEKIKVLQNLQEHLVQLQIVELQPYQ